MKMYQIIPFFLFLPIFGIGQFTSSIDIVAGINYSYRSLQTESSDEIVGFILDNRAKEVGKSNWSGGLNFNVKLVKRFYLKAGFRYTSLGYKRTMTNLKWGSEHDGNGGFIEDPSLPKEAHFTYDYRFIEMPIAIRWEYGERKWSPFIEAGLAPSFYLHTRTKTTTNLGSEVSFKDGHVANFRRSHAVGMLSLGIKYTINEKLQFFGQPTFRYHFTSLSDGPIKENLYNYGIEVGLRRRIK